MNCNITVGRTDLSSNQYFVGEFIICEHFFFMILAVINQLWTYG